MGFRDTNTPQRACINNTCVSSITENASLFKKAFLLTSHGLPLVKFSRFEICCISMCTTKFSNLHLDVVSGYEISELVDLVPQ